MMLYKHIQDAFTSGDEKNPQGGSSTPAGKCMPYEW